MLNQILEACKSTPRGLCLEEIAHGLKKEPAVIEGMIAQLLHMGMLVEHPVQTVCETCPARASCVLIERSVSLYSVPKHTMEEYNRFGPELHTPDR